MSLGIRLFYTQFFFIIIEKDKKSIYRYVFGI